IDHVLIGQPDAARGDRMSNVFGLVGAMDTKQRVLATGIKVQGARAHRIARAAFDVVRKRAKPALLVRSRRPTRPFLLTPNRAYAGPSLSSLAHGRAVPNRLAPRQHVVDEGSTSIDEDRARRLLAGVLNDLALIGGRNRHALIGRIRKLSPIARCEFGVPRRS